MPPRRRALLAAASWLSFDAAGHPMRSARPASAAPAPAAAPEASAQAAADTPRRLLLVNAEFPPFVMPPGDPQGPGIDIDIAREAMRRSGYALEVQLVPWRRALQMLEFGDADLTTTLRRGGERERFLRYSLGYRHALPYHFYSRADGSLPVGHLERLDQLAGLAVGLTSGFHYPPGIREAPGVRIHEGKDLPTTVQMLAAGRTDLIVVNHLAGAWIIRRLGLGARLQRQPFVYLSDSPVFMAFSRQRHADGAALRAMDRGLRQMQADGSLRRIEARYTGE